MAISAGGRRGKVDCTEVFISLKPAPVSVTIEHWTIDHRVFAFDTFVRNAKSERIFCCQYNIVPHYYGLKILERQEVFKKKSRLNL